jgi:Protein of unknown function (DUF1279)
MPDVPAPLPAKPSLSDKLKKLADEYGTIAICVYLTTSLLTFAGFFLAIKMGFQVEGTAGSATVAGAAWVGMKLTMVIRVPIALVLTPIVARGWWRYFPRAPSSPN